jgi:nitrite reductase/ring-hydroxylating ferredoxin subunit
MEHNAQIRVIERLLEHRDNGTNVDAGCQVKNPVSAYTCKEIAAREWDEFFSNYPHVLGLSADLPEPGSFLTSDNLGKPILCTRDDSGAFHAFVNVCRHRGTVVESARRGKKRQFNCPFHAWGYNHRGDLIAVPKEDQFGAVDRSCHGLVELPAVERHGLLWVHPDPNGVMDIAAQLGDLDAELAGWNLAQDIQQGETAYDHAMNWKLAIDTFGETYHFNTLHRDTLAKDFYGNTQLYETYERNHRMMLCLKNIDLVRNLPHEEWNVLHAALPVYYLFPNVQLIIGAAGPTLIRVYPDGGNPHKSRSEISFYLNPVVNEALLTERGREVYGNVEERMHGFADVIRDEDYVAAASAHRGARSGAQEYVIFGRNEPALHHYHNTYREALGMPPLEVVG